MNKFIYLTVGLFVICCYINDNDVDEFDLCSECIEYS